MQFSRFDIDQFLSGYWQKKPLLIKNPWTSWRNPMDPDELAGLACEAGIESRLIIQTPQGAADALKVEHGPIAESRFGTLGKGPWTLLVQAVDHAVPDVAALLEPFRFIPNWRIDDVMVSYATDQGGVGPHFDHYDVFLIQGLGKRRWRVGPLCNDDTPLLPHDDLRLLADFEATDEWILEPGDILYVPPGIAHEGVAVGDDCMTYSIGFRAPARHELIEEWFDHLVEQMKDDDRYCDPDLRAQANPGEISPEAIAHLHGMITDVVQDRDAFARWFGQHNSARKNAELDWQPEEPIDAEEVGALLADDVPLCRNPASRFSFIRQSAQSVLMFVDGQSFECSGDAMTFAEQLCAQDRVILDRDGAKSAPVMALIVALMNTGSVAFDQED